MSELKFWFSPGACSLAPHVLLHEVRAKFEPVAVTLSEGAQLTETFARINPKKRVPVLSIDGAVITEVPAISIAISDLSPERGLMGQTSLDRARVSEWMAWLSGTLHGQGFGAFWRPQRFSDNPDEFDGIRAKGRATIADGFAYIEGRLSEPYATGNAFTAADPYLLVFYRWGNGVGFDMATAFPKYTSLVRRLIKRKSVASALSVEGLDEEKLNDKGPPAAVHSRSTTTAEGFAA